MSDRSTLSLVSPTSLLSGVVGGLAHGVLAVVLWNQWFDTLGEMLTVKPLNAVYIGLGMFLLGFVPAMFYAEQRVVSPAIIVVVLLFLSVFGSWVTGSARAPSAVPTPFSLYILSWVGIVVLVGITGGVELRRNHRTTG